MSASTVDIRVSSLLLILLASALDFWEGDIWRPRERILETSFSSLVSVSFFFSWYIVKVELQSNSGVMFLRQWTQSSSSSRSRSREISRSVCSQLLRRPYEDSVANDELGTDDAVKKENVPLVRFLDRRLILTLIRVSFYNFIVFRIESTKKQHLHVMEDPTVLSTSVDDRDTFDRFWQWQELDLRQLYRYSELDCADNVRRCVWSIVLVDRTSCIDYVSQIRPLEVETMPSSSKSVCEWHVGQHEGIKFPADVPSTSLAFTNFFVLRLDLTKKLLQSMKGLDCPIKKTDNDKCRLSITFSNFTVLRSELTKKKLQTVKEDRTCCRDDWRWQQFGFRQLYRWYKVDWCTSFTILRTTSVTNLK